MAPKDVGKSTLIISALKASMPVALTFFKDLMVFATSLTVGVFTLISRSLEAGEGATVFRGQLYDHLQFFLSLFKEPSYFFKML